MKWRDIKEEWPLSNSEVIVYYFLEDKDLYMAELIHEKQIDKISSKELYWIESPIKNYKNHRGK